MKKLIRITTVPISLEKLLEDQLEFMSDYFEVIAVSSDKKRLEKYGEKAGIRTRHIEMTRTISPLKDLVSLVKLIFFFLKERPDIVHTHTPKAGTLGMLAAKIAGVKVRMHTVAGLPLLEVKGKKRKLLDIVEKITYKAASKVYPNSFGLKAIIQENGYCDTSKLKVIGNGSSNGINTEYFDPKLFSEDDKIHLRKSLGIAKFDFVFIFVGRLVGDKGINELINAFKSLSKTGQGKGVKLVLVGPLEEDLDPLEKETVREIELNSNIISVGYQNDVSPYFSISDALVFPSYREGFPNVLLQAGAMGLPAIVSDINGCNEIIMEGENGLIVPVKKVSELKTAMYSIYTDVELCSTLKQNARALIVDQYNRSYIHEKILEEYNTLLKNG